MTSRMRRGKREICLWWWITWVHRLPTMTSLISVTKWVLPSTINATRNSLGRAEIKENEGPGEHHGTACLRSSTRLQVLLGASCRTLPCLSHKLDPMAVHWPTLTEFICGHTQMQTLESEALETGDGGEKDEATGLPVLGIILVCRWYRQTLIVTVEETYYVPTE